MKKIILLLVLCVSSFSLAITEDDILGLWITPKSKKGNQLIIEIYKTKNNLFNGRIKDMTIPKYTEGKLIGQDRLDLKNPNEKLRNRKIIGINFIYSYSYNKKNQKYENGFMYLPWIGKEFYSYMKLNKDNTLTVKGSIDKAGFFGKKQIWKKLNLSK